MHVHVHTVLRETVTFLTFFCTCTCVRNIYHPLCFSPVYIAADSRDIHSVNPYMIPSNSENLQNPSPGMHQILFSVELSRAFIHEVL